MFSGAIKGLQSLKGQPKLSREKRALGREYICELFKAGFSPAEIRYLAGGKDSPWKESTIKKYCKGLEVKDTAMKTKTLQLLEEYVLADGDWDELALYSAQKKALTEENLSFDELLEFKKGVEGKGINLDEFAFLYNEVTSHSRDWKTFVKAVSTTLDLIGLGYDFEGLKALHEKTITLGGIKKVLFSILHAITEEDSKRRLQEFTDTAKALDDQMRQSEIRRDTVTSETKLIQGHFDFARTLIDEYRIDPLSFRIIIDTCRKYGEPMNILQTINTYANLRDLEINVAMQTGWLQGLIDEIQRFKVTKETHQGEVEDLYRRIGVIEERTKNYRVLQNISNLITDPAHTQLTPMEFMLLAQTLFLNLRIYSKTHSDNLLKWTLYVANDLEKAVNSLNKILGESDGKTA
ncbi:hypothetical protein E4H04_04840 [Candidatus Bathyarchaeota archaeon]|nr:MAG: hypothetical protein E4H04_04840 [Candidatus Bathyarchaeota archaeon]